MTQVVNKVTVNLAYANGFEELKENDVNSILERFIRDSSSTNVRECVASLQEKGYEETEIDCMLDFQAERYSLAFLELKGYLRVSTQHGQMIEKWLRHDYRYVDSSFTKERNEEGFKVKATFELHKKLRQEKKAQEQKALDDKKKKEQDELEQEKQKQLEELKGWALENGSELLLERVNGNFEWQELAEEEYCNSFLPKGATYLEEPDRSYEVTKPNLAMIKSLKDFHNELWPSKFYGKSAAEQESIFQDMIKNSTHVARAQVMQQLEERKILPGIIPSSLKLMNYVYEASEDDKRYAYENDDVAEDNIKTVIQFKIRTVTGNVRIFEKVLR